MGAVKCEKSLFLYFKSGPGILKLCNVVFAVISLICVSVACSVKAKHADENPRMKAIDCYNFEDKNIKGLIIWRIYLLLDIISSVVVLCLFLLIPHIRTHEKVKLIMMLYNLIQSISHIYIWMVGTLNETLQLYFIDNPLSAVSHFPHLPGIYAAIAFTQLNGICFFFGVFVYGQGFTTVIGDVDWNANKEEEVNSEDPSQVSQSAPESMEMSGEQTVDTSAVETADNSVDPSAEKMTK